MAVPEDQKRLSSLLEALDTLVDQHCNLLRAGPVDEAESVQRRIAQLADSIAPLASRLREEGNLPRALNHKASAILTRYQKAVAAHALRIEELRRQIGTIDAARSRAATLRPVYGYKGSKRASAASGASLDLSG